MPADNVIALVGQNFHDIPALLREMADAIERGDHGDVVSGAGVLLDRDGRPVVFGWGQTDSVHSIGMFQIGATWLATHRAERD